MNQLRNQTSQNNPHFDQHKKRAENKDELDSRKNEEQEFNNGKQTHNEKEKKSKKPGNHDDKH